MLVIAKCAQQDCEAHKGRLQISDLPCQHEVAFPWSSSELVRFAWWAGSSASLFCPSCCEQPRPPNASAMLAVCAAVDRRAARCSAHWRHAHACGLRQYRQQEGAALLHPVEALAGVNACSLRRCRQRDRRSPGGAPRLRSTPPSTAGRRSARPGGRSPGGARHRKTPAAARQRWPAAACCAAPRRTPRTTAAGAPSTPV